MSIIGFIRENVVWLSAGALLTFISSFGQTFFISLFAGQIRDTFQLTHGEWGGIYTLGTAVSAFVMVWAGGLSDQFRVRNLASVVLLLLAVACLLMAFNPVWWGLFLVIFALRFAGQGMTGHIAIVAMSRWFTASRGKAISIATLGFSIGEALLPLIFVSLLAVFDWRFLWGLAAILTMMSIPALIALLKHERTPQSIAKDHPTFGMLGKQWLRSNVIKHWLFWLMIPALLGPSAFGTAFFFHQVHYAEIKQISHLDLVAFFPFYTLIGIVAMVASGWALDRFGTPRLIPYMLIPAVFAFMTFAGADTYVDIAFGFFFLALTTGFNATLPPAFWAEFYGTAHIGSIKALASAVMVLGSAIGPGLTGYGIDAGIGLESQFVFVAIYFVFATLMMTAGVTRAKPSLSATS